MGGNIGAVSTWIWRPIGQSGTYYTSQGSHCATGPPPPTAHWFTFHGRSIHHRHTMFPTNTCALPPTSDFSTIPYWILLFFTTIPPTFLFTCYRHIISTDIPFFVLPLIPYHIIWILFLTAIPPTFHFTLYHNIIPPTVHLACSHHATDVPFPHETCCFTADIRFYQYILAH